MPTSATKPKPKEPGVQAKGESDRAFAARVKRERAALFAKPKNPPPPEGQPASVFASGEIKGLSEMARSACHWMERFLIVDDMGTRLRLYRAQVKFIKDLYATDRHGDRKVRVAIWSAARKAGKSTIAGAVTLYDMSGPFAPRGGYWACAAGGSRDQARLVWNAIARMIDRSAPLRQRFMIGESAGKMVNNRNLNWLEALSTSARSAQGRECYGSVFDELSEAKNTTLLNALTMSGRKKSAGTHLIVSTNSTAPGNPLLAYLEMIKVAHARGELLDHIAHVHAADLTRMGVFSDRAIKAANPGWDADPPMVDWAVIDADRVKARNNPMDRAEYIARRLNASSGNAASIVDPARWAQFGVAPTARDSTRRDHLGETCVLGVDLSQTTDMSAVVAYFPDDGYIESAAWMPGDTLEDAEERDKAPYGAWRDEGWLLTSPGKVVNYRDIAGYIVKACERWNVIKVRYDAYMFPSLRNSLISLGVDVESDAFGELWEPFAQGYKNYTPAVAELKRLIEVGGLTHLGDPVLASAMVSVKIETSKNQATDAMRPVKATQLSRIDCAVALMMACLPYDAGASERRQSKGAPSRYLDLIGA